MNTRNETPLPTETDPLRSRVQRLGLHGLLAHWATVADKPWVTELCDYEERERRRRSLARRLSEARIGAFKPMADFDWSWPKKIDRDAVDDVLSPALVEEGSNAIVLGPNGVGKSMILCNIAYRAILCGHTVCFTTASDMLNDLGAQETSNSFKRRLRRYCQPKLLCIDEVGYLSYDSRYADLFFEIVSRRYKQSRSIVLTTNKPFSEWSQVFPNAACVVTLVDRLLHRSELIAIEADSFRLKEATERATNKAKQRRIHRNRSDLSPG